MSPQASNFKNSFSENYWQIFFILSLIGLAVVAIILIDAKELPLTIIAALLGVVMTIFATFFLLKGQGRQQAALQAEQIRQSNIAKLEQEIFKQKLFTYQQFLESLKNYVECHSDANRDKLKFHTAALAIHCTAANTIIEINNRVAKILEMYQGADVNDQHLLLALFDISDFLQSTLYSSSSVQRTDQLTASIINLSQTLDADEDISNSEDNLDEDVSHDNESDQPLQTNELLNKINRQGWDLNAGNDSIVIVNSSQNLTIRFRRPRKGAFYIVEVVAPKDNTSLSKDLKANFNGSRNGFVWWRNLTSLPNYGLRVGQLVENFHQNPKVQNVIFKWIIKLTDFINNSSIK